MKRVDSLAILCCVIAVELAACTVGAGGGGSNSPTPPPSGGSAQHMYVSSVGQSGSALLVYQMPVTSSSTPVASLSVIGAPLQLLVDKNGMLFMPFLGTNILWAYKTPVTNASTPAMILYTKSQDPTSVAEDSNGNLYVGITTTNCCIDIFSAPLASGMTAGAEMTSNGVSPNGLAFVRGLTTDPSNNLYVASNTSVIKMTAPISASSVPSANVPAPKAFAYDVDLDASGNVYVANSTAQGTLDVFNQPFTSSSKRAFGIAFPGVAYLQGMAFDPSGNLWLTDPGNDIWEIAAPITASSVPQKILTGVPGGYGIAFGP